MTPTQYGEHKHETCLYGSLNPAWHVAGAIEEPTLVPICHWKPPEPCPPAIIRAWGGLVEFERDCAVCTAHRVEVAA